MGIFGKRQRSHRLPGNIIDLMERFGRVEFDPQGSGEDMGSIWMETQAPLQPFAKAEPDGFLIALAEAVLPVGDWAVYGASRTLREFFGSKEKEVFHQHPSYNAIMDATIAFLRAKRVPPMNVRGYEWQHWFVMGGTHDTWLPQLSIPSQDATLNSSEAWMEIGTVHFDNSRYAEALAAYDRALNLSPAYAQAHAYKADVLTQLKRYEEALVAYDQAIWFDPTDAGSYANKGLALAKLRRYQEALEVYDHALQLNPTVVGGHIDRGDALTSLKRYEEALAAYERAFQLDPARALAYSGKGTVLAELKRYEEALAAYERAFQLDPSDAGACCGKGLMLTRLNRHEEALIAWGTVLQLNLLNPLNTSNALAYTHIGIALTGLNQYAEALDFYNRALQLNPNDTLARTGKNLLLTRLNHYEE